MSTLSAIHRATIGTSDFQLGDFELGEDPVVKDGRMTGRVVVLRGWGWVEGTDATDLAAKLATIMADFRASGRDLEIFGPGGTSMVRVPAATCLEGGPHVSFRLRAGLDGGTAVTRMFNLEVAAETVEVGGGPPSTPTYQAKVETAPDGMRVITWTGDLSTAAGGADDAFKTLGATFRKAYPASRWVLSHTFEQTLTGDKGKFSLVVTESVADLPAAGDDATLAVEGSASFVRDRDEQMRLQRTWSFDLAVVGDPMALLTAIRPQGVPLLRESVQVGRYPHKRLQATFVTLTGGDGNALLNWTCSFQLNKAATVYDKHRYPGLVPIYVAQPLDDSTLRVTGSAIGAKTWIEPPTLPSVWPLLAQPQRGWRVLNAIEWQTDWDFLVAIPPDAKINLADQLKLLSRPADVKPMPGDVDPGKVPTGPPGTPR